MIKDTWSQGTIAVIGQSPYQVTQCGDRLHVTRCRDAVPVISFGTSELDIFNVVLNQSILPLSGRSHTYTCITGGAQVIDTSLSAEQSGDTQLVPTQNVRPL